MTLQIFFFLQKLYLKIPNAITIFTHKTLSLRYCALVSLIHPRSTIVIKKKMMFFLSYLPSDLIRFFLYLSLPFLSTLSSFTHSPYVLFRLNTGPSCLHVADIPFVVSDGSRGNSMRKKPPQTQRARGLCSRRCHARKKKVHSQRGFS